MPKNERSFFLNDGALHCFFATSDRAGTPVQRHGHPCHPHVQLNNMEEPRIPVSDSRYPAEECCKPCRPRQRRGAFWGISHGNGPSNRAGHAPLRNMHSRKTRLRPAVASAIAKDYGVGKTRASRLWGSTYRAAADGRPGHRYVLQEEGWPAVEFNAAKEENRRMPPRTMLPGYVFRQRKVEVEGPDVQVGKSSLRKWLNVMVGSTMPQRSRHI